MRAGSRAGGALLAVAALAALVLVSGPSARGDVVQRGGLRVAFEGKIRPRALPRVGVAPIAFSMGGTIATADGSQPPALRRMEIAINRHGRFDYRGLPSCALEQIQPATTANALRTCRSALVGEGTFNANVAIPEQSPFPSQGKLLAFNGTEGGKPVIFAHVYGTDPVPTSYTLTLRIAPAKGTFGTVLTASLPEVTSNIAFVTGITLTLNRRFSYRGERHGYLSAGCPAPKGFPGTVFPLLRAGFFFADGRTLATTLNRSCRAR